MSATNASTTDRVWRLLNTLAPVGAAVAILAAVTLLAAVGWLLYALPAPVGSAHIAPPVPPKALPERAAALPRSNPAPPASHRVPVAQPPVAPGGATAPRPVHPAAPPAAVAPPAAAAPPVTSGGNSDAAKNRQIGQALSRLGQHPGAERRLGLPP